MTLRLFSALELPAPITESLAALRHRLQGQMPRQSVRWVQPRNIHLTLKFYGEVKPEQVAALQESVTHAVLGCAPLTLALNGLGLFPNAVRPRVVWVGLGGELEALGALQAAVEQGAAGLGFPPEARGFTPHLTLGRVTENLRPPDRPRISAALRALTFAPQTFTVEQVALIRSELKPAGSVYTRLFSAPLVG